MVIKKALFYLFLVSIPFGTRLFLHKFTNGFHEYESMWLYASDFFLVLFLTFSFAGIKDLKSEILNLKSKIILPSLFLLFVFISIFFASSFGLALYKFLRLLFLILMAFAVANLLKDKTVFKAALFIIAVLAAIQSLIGFMQFTGQENLGLQILGESPISVSDGGTSKIIIEGAAVMRAYGIFPHPNILSSFLLLGLFSCYYFWLRRPSEKKIFSSFKNLLSDLIIGFGIFIIAFGLMLSFSRASWIIISIISIALIIYLFIKRKYFLQTFRLAVFLAAISLIFILYFNAYIFPRAKVSVNEPAVTERFIYNRLGVDLIKNNWLGVGIGNQVIYSVENGVYKKFGMNKVWQWQPIHNLYLLVGAEIGIIGALLFIIFFVSLFLNSKPKKTNYKKIADSNNNKLLGFHSLETGISEAILASLLLFGLFDHFLWAIWQGQLMLWFAVGILISARRVYS